MARWRRRNQRLIFRRRASRGFSLMETLVAALILSLTLVVLLSLFPYSVIGLKKGEQLSTAVDIARSTLEAMRSRKFDEVAAAPPLDTVVNGTKFRTEVFLDPVSEDEPQLRADLKHVRVVVSWSIRAAADLNDEFTSYSSETTFFNFKTY